MRFERTTLRLGGECSIQLSYDDRITSEMLLMIDLLTITIKRTISDVIHDKADDDCRQGIHAGMLLNKHR